MAEDEARIDLARDNQVRSLRFVHAVEHRIRVHLAHGRQEVEREVVADDRCARQQSVTVVAQALQPPANYEPHSFWNIQLAGDDLRPPLTAVVHQLLLLEQILEHLLDEERITLGLAHNELE